MSVLHQLVRDIASIEAQTRHSNIRFVIDARTAHPYGVRHRIKFFAGQARRILELDVRRCTEHCTVLRVHTHNGRTHGHV